MKTSEIRFKVELDDQRIPEKIFWTATDNAHSGLVETKAISVAVWDHVQSQTLRIDLWSKEMLVDDMKRFYVDMLAGLAASLRQATSDDYMAGQMEELCERLTEYILSQSN